MRIRKLYKTATMVACGGMLLQGGGCVSQELLPFLIDVAVNVGISALLSAVLGTPVL